MTNQKNAIKVEVKVEFKFEVSLFDALKMRIAGPEIRRKIANKIYRTLNRNEALARLEKINQELKAINPEMDPDFEVQV